MAAVIGARPPDRRWGRWCIAGVGLAAAILFALPFGGLPWTTPWRALHFLNGDGAAIAVSVGYTLLAIAIDVALGTPLAWWLARRKFRGKLLVEVMVLLPLLAPPLVMGLLLAMAYGPYGWAGAPLQRLGLALSNTPSGFVLAEVYASAPYYVIGARIAFEGVPRELEQVGLSLGRSPWQVFRRVTLPLSTGGLAAGLALAWVRALGEYGMVLVLAYFPHGMPVQLWVDLQDSGLDAVYPLLWVLIAIALPFPLLLGLWSRRGSVAAH